MGKWPQEVLDWLAENVPGRTTKEVTELINQQEFDEKYGFVFTESIVKGAKSRYHIKSGTPTGNSKGYSHKYPEGMLEFVESIAHGKSTAELVEAVNDRYGAGTINIPKMKAYKRNHGINTGLTGRFEPGSVPANKGKKISPEVYEKCAPTMFHKGQQPTNHKPVGTISVRNNYKRGAKCVYEKVAEPNVWRRKSVLEWERHNGPVPKGKMIIFADGDPLNTDISNLMMIDMSQNAVMNHQGIRGNDRESMEAAINVASLKIAISEKKKGKKQGRSKKVEPGVGSSFSDEIDKNDNLILRKRGSNNG